MRRKLTSILLGMAFIIVLSGCTIALDSDGEQNRTSEDALKESVFTEEFDGLADTEDRIGEESADMGKTGDITSDVVYVTDENGRTAQILEGYLYGFWDGVQIISGIL